MQVTLYGTRGSLPVSGKQVRCVGGNTTCVRVDSCCLPDGHWLAIDAGTGIRPLGRDMQEKSVTNLMLLFTHYHPDHTWGIHFFGPLHNPAAKVDYYGPVELEIGPEELLRTLFKTPFFPVPFEALSAQQRFYPLRRPEETVLVIHPEGGMAEFGLDAFRSYGQHVPAQIPMGDGWYRLKECLVIKMLYSNHPQRTISYRFEEGPTGKVFVFLTDHENTYAVEPALVRHVRAADLLIMDCQYAGEVYENRVGYGHSTPEYCVTVAGKGQVKRLGLTHHDPDADDKVVFKVLEEAVAKSIHFPVKVDIFVAKDELEVAV